MVVAHNGENHAATNHHTGEVQSSTTLAASSSGGSNSRSLYMGVGVASLVVAAVLLVLVLRNTRKVPEAVSDAESTD